MSDTHIPKKPYLLRAMFDWIIDNLQTPFIIVDATCENVIVPVEFIKDNKITLNISDSAVKNLDINNDSLSFVARFSGVSHEVFVSIRAVMGIYSKETGQGMIFSEESFDENTESKSSGDIKQVSKKPHLKLV